MGIYDRDYFRDDDRNERPRRSRSDGFSAVAILIFLNVALFFLDQASGGALFNRMALYGEAARYPLEWYRCLTYGFAHDPSGFWHILCNMLALFFFGPPLERLYGRREFALFYLAATVFGGIVWNVVNFGANAAALGASGAISAVIILFATRYPRAQVLIFGIIPTPAWLAGVAFVVYDAIGARGNFDNIAHDVHLAGAVFGFLYFLSKVNFSRLTIGTGRNRKSLKNLFGGSRLKKTGGASSESTSKNAVGSAASRWSRSTLSEKKSSGEVAFEQLEAEVDRLLFKIGETGEESLTAAERETLRRASLEYQKRQKQDGRSQ